MVGGGGQGSAEAICPLTDDMCHLAQLTLCDRWGPCNPS